MEAPDLPPFVLTERDALLAEIHETFSKVNRQGGVSWSEADVIDDYGSPEKRAAARAKDRDARWQDLLEDQNWEPANGGRWAFLDAIGFRYYLPAAMVRAVHQGWDAGILFYLRFPEGDLRDYTQAHWTLLNLPQRLCIKRFLQYMGIVSAYRMAENDEYGWYAALKSYWGRITDDGVREDPLSASHRSSRNRRR